MAHRIDWCAIENDYLITRMTLRELEAKHGCPRNTISRRANKEGWKRDMSEAVRKVTRALLIEEVAQQVSAQQIEGVTQHTIHQLKSNTEAVMAAAEVNKQVILSHRAGLKKITTIRDKLLDYVETAVDALLVDPEPRARSTLIDDLKRLAEVDERVRKGEREAFGLDADKDTNRAGVDELLAKINRD